MNGLEAIRWKVKNSVMLLFYSNLLFDSSYEQARFELLSPSRSTNADHWATATKYYESKQTRVSG